MLLLTLALVGLTPPVDAIHTVATLAAPRPRVAIVTLRNDGVDAKVIPQIVDALAHQLSRDGRCEVLTTTEIQAVLGLEATKQAMNCSSGSCQAMDDITRALDVRYLVAGAVSPRDDGFAVTASLVDVQGGAVVSRAASNVRSDDLTQAMRSPADQLLAPLLQTETTASSSTTEPERTEERKEGGPPILAFVGIGLTGVALVGVATGGVLWGVDDNTIRDTTTEFDAKEEARSRYPLDQALTIGSGAMVLVGGSVAALGFFMAGGE